MAEETREKLEEIEKLTDNLSRAFTKMRTEIEKSAKETNVWVDATKALQSAQSGMQRTQESLKNIGKEINKNKKEEARLNSIVLPQLVESRKIIPALQQANIKLHANKVAILQSYRTERDRKELAEKMVKIHEALIKPLIEESREFGKIKSLVMDVAKGGLTAWLALLQASVERWKELDKAAGDFRNKTGFLISQTRELNNSVREVNVEMAQIGVGLDEAYGAASALTNQFQVIGIVTKDMIKDTAQMAANLGISVEDSAKIRSIFTSISKSSGITATQMMGAAAKLAEMGGVAPSMVMRDIAEASEESLKFLSKSPVALMRAAVEARRLGTTINSLSKSARGFLNFQDSITSELTASAMVGRSLNFQAARRAAWEKDIVKSRQLAMREISKLGDFNALNVLQQEEIAKAAGMTVEEIIQQQNQQKILSALEKERPEMFKEYMAMQKKLREDEKAGTNDLVKQGEELVRRQMRQTELNKLTNAFKQIWTDITDLLLPIANFIMPIIITAVRLLAIPIKIVAALVRGFLRAFDGIGKSLRSGASGALSFEKIISKISNVVDKYLVPTFEFLGEAIGRVLNLIVLMRVVVGRVADAFTPFDYVANIFTRFANNILRASKNLMSFKELALRTYLSVKEAISGVYMTVKEIFSGSARIQKAFDYVGNSVLKMTKLFERFGLGIGKFFGDIASSASKFFGKFPKFMSVFTPIKNIFSGIASAASKVFSILSGGGSVGGLLGPLMKGISGIAKFIGTFAKFLGPIGLIINAVQILWELGSKLMDIWSDDNLDIGDQILNSILAIPGAIFDVMISPFIDLGVWILKKFGVDIPNGVVDGIKSVGKDIFQFLTMPFVKTLRWLKTTFMANSPSEIGLGIVDGIKSVGSMLFDVLSSPFKKVINFVSNMFGGKYVGIGRMIIDGIKSIGGNIFDTLSSAFKKVMEFVSNIPLIGRFFGGKDASKAAIEAKTIVESKINHIVEIVNMDELKMSIDKLTEAISLLGGAAGGATPVVNVNNNTDAMIEKLDQLIDLLEGGAVAVHMDGALVSKALARTA